MKRIGGKRKFFGKHEFFLFSSLLFLALFSSGNARAWYDHTVVMDWILPRLQKEIPRPTPNLQWKDPVVRPTEVQKREYYDFASLLLLNPTAELPSMKAKTVEALLRLGAEDPDHGLDRDLPETADPNDDRRFMGGATGHGATGFRHMYWPGWNWKKPLATFQIPPRPLGQTPDRVALLANEARDRIRKGDHVWGIRILGWAIHYLQDLSQPFHAAQLPSIRMVDWKALFVWPPSKIFENLLRETTRTITNYHWAYEGYTRYALLRGDKSPFKNCFSESAGSILVSSPRDLAIEITNRSIERAPRMGRSLLRLVGTHLKDPGVSIPLDPSQVNEENLLTNPELADAREVLDRVTCDSLRLSADATIWIVNYVLNPK